jgi:hypothetical protein
VADDRGVGTVRGMGGGGGLAVFALIALLAHLGGLALVANDCRVGVRGMGRGGSLAFFAFFTLFPWMRGMGGHRRVARVAAVARVTPVRCHAAMADAAVPDAAVGGGHSTVAGAPMAGSTRATVTGS